MQGGSIVNDQTSPGVAYLIECAEETTIDSRLFAIYEALAEAGGVIAQDYLIKVARETSAGPKQQLLIRLIGRASRAQIH
jgi:hypothetical protein